MMLSRITRVKIKSNLRLILTRILKRCILDRSKMIRTYVKWIKTSKMSMEQDKRKASKVTISIHMSSITSNKTKTFSSLVKKSGNSFSKGMEANQFLEDTLDQPTLEAGCKLI